MLVIYGLLQERVMSAPYIEGKELVFFRDSIFLVFCNRIVAIVFAGVMACANGESFRNRAPLWKYLAISFSNVYASACQYEALKFVSFPVQMLGKSFKMMPVMIWGMLVSRKRYSSSDWLVAVVVTGGVMEFLMTGPIGSDAGLTESRPGILLLMAFLTLDGFTSTFQEKLFKDHVTSKYNQMLYINLGSAVISSCTLVATGGFTRAVDFAFVHPDFVKDAVVLSASAVGAQWFIYSQVKEFGALVFAATMNVRQVVSILLSYLWYQHPCTSLQVIGLLTVFGALFYKSFVNMVAVLSKGEQQPLVVGSREPMSSSKV